MSPEMNERQKILEHILQGCGPHLVIGPLVWQPSDGSSNRRWYFVVGGGEKRFRFDQISLGDAKDKADGERQRSEFVFMLAQAIIAAKKGIVLHNFEDELDMARWCEAIWPGTKTSGIRADVENERAAAPPPGA